MEDTELRISALEKGSDKNEEAHARFAEKLEQIGKDQVRTETTYATILEKLSALETKVDGLMAKPSKRWETIVAAILTATIAALVTYIVKGG